MLPNITLTLRKLIILPVTIITIFFLFEVIVRSVYTSPSIRTGGGNWPRYLASSRLFYGYEGYAENSTNRFGFFDREWKFGNQNKNIMFLSDSFLAGVHVPREKHFLEALRRERRDLNFFNFGIRGGELQQYPAILIDYLSKVRPSQVFLMINDMDLLDLTSEAINEMHFKVDVQGIVAEYDKIPLEKPGLLRKILGHSALVTHVFRKSQKLKTILYKRSFFIAKSNKDRPTKKDVALAIDLIKTIRSMLISNKTKFSIIYLPSIQYEDDGEVRYLNPEVRSQLLELGSNQLKILDVSVDMAKSYQESGTLAVGFQNMIVGSGHLNSEGHKIVARAILESGALK